MGVLRGVDGRFYEVPDDQLDGFLIPESDVKDKLDEAAAGGSAPPPAPGGGGAGAAGGGTPSVIVQVYGAAGADSGPPPGEPGETADQTQEGAEVTPYGWGHWHNHHWHNHWHNHHWHNHHWHNCY